MANQQPKPETRSIVIQTRELLNDNKQQLENALGELQRYVTPDKLIRVVMTTIQEDWELLKCEPKTIFASTIQLAQVGLVPDGFLGQAYLVPFKNGYLSKKLDRDVYEATPMIGYKGFGELIARSGKANSHDAAVVYENDKFDFEKGSDPFIKHRQALSNRGAMIGAFAIVYMKEGPVRFEIMGAEEIEKIKTDAAKGADDKNSPWKKWPEAMWRKTPMRRLASWLALSPEFQRAGAMDELADMGRMKLVETQGGAAMWVPADRQPEPPPTPQVRRMETITAQTEAKPAEESKTGTPKTGTPDPTTEAVQEEQVETTEEAASEESPRELTQEEQAALDTSRRASPFASQDKARAGTNPEVAQAVTENPPPKPQHKPGADAPEGYDPGGKHISMNRVGRIFAIARAAAGEGFNEEEFKRLVSKAYNITDIRLFPNDKKTYDKFCAEVGGDKLKLKH